MTSHLTQDEIDALQLTSLPRDTPFLIQGVSQGMFSIARYYGSADYNGAHYVYLNDADELIRADVVKWLKGFRKSNRKAKATP